jgi:hypothetical protein
MAEMRTRFFSRSEKPILIPGRSKAKASNRYKNAVRAVTKTTPVAGFIRKADIRCPWERRTTARVEPHVGQGIPVIALKTQ